MPAEPARRSSPLSERLTPEAVERAFPSAALAQARLVIDEGRLSRPDLRGQKVESIVVGDDRIARRVQLAWGERGLESACTCGHRQCPHGAALALLVADEAPLPGAPSAPPAPSPREQERRRREARGKTEIFVISRLGATRLLGEYEVASPSSQAYRVTLRSLDDPHNGCSCPDFATNLLGTCKHVEAVLHHLRRDAPRRLQRALFDAGEPYLHLVFEPEETVALHHAPGTAARFAARHFGPDGRLRLPLAQVWPELSRDAVEAGVAIPPEVTRVAERALEAERREKRRRQVEEEVRAAGREPPGLRLPLYPYQVEGVAFLAARGRALLADEMGLGKTAQAIGALEALARRGEVRRTLVVCPTSLKHQWLRELQQFSGMAADEVAVIPGSREERRARYADPPRVLITSYELARADERELLDLAPDLLILDEAQRIKNWRTRTATVVKRIPSRFAFVLTGTPLENRLDDLYSLMQVVDPHLFGPLWRFNQEFTDLDEAGKPTGYRNLDRLRARIAPAVLRRRKEEVLADLPERLVSRRVVPLTPEQRELHDEAEASAGRLLAQLKKRALTPPEEQRLMRAFQRMRMACDAAALVREDAPPGAPKLDELERLLEEICLEEGRKVVVFSEWEKMQGLAAEVCDWLGVPYVRLHGGVPGAQRGALVDRFREDPACKVFLSTDAGGVGLNLQAASHVVNLDLPWNPAVLAQRIGRVHRLGQRQPVNVVLLVSEGSFEERLEGGLDSKRALFAAAVGDDADTTALERTSLARRIAAALEGAGAPGPAPAAAPEPEPEEDAARAARRALVTVAERKRAGGDALLAAGQPADALALFRDAIARALRALESARRSGRGGGGAAGGAARPPAARGDPGRGRRRRLCARRRGRPRLRGGAALAPAGAGAGGGGRRPPPGGPGPRRCHLSTMGGRLSPSTPGSARWRRSDRWSCTARPPRSRPAGGRPRAAAPRRPGRAAGTPWPPGAPARPARRSRTRSR
ncbi:MAG: DEAD/DEAH box helicase [Anaeromyxobacter sp.]